MRYQPIEVDGQWFVWDLKHPDEPPTKFSGQREALLASRAWNLLAGCGSETLEGIE